MEIKTILVTGGAGFIGSNFIYYLLDEHPGMRVVCLDALTYAGDIKLLDSAMKHSDFAFYRCDICDKERVFEIFRAEKPDAVVNFAAESHVDRAIADPSVFLRTNIIGTQVIMDACLEYGVGRFHQISTDEVYGDLPLDSSDFFTESSPLRPGNPYSASKASADLLVMAYRHTYGLGATLSRCSNNYGPRQFPEKLIPLMIKNALEDKPMPVYGDGKNVRDWIYVLDHCRAIDAILSLGRIGEIYNIGARCEICNNDIVSLVCEKLGRSRSLITHVADRKGHDRRYSIDPSKLERETGWHARVSFDEGFGATLDYYLKAIPHN